jgi:bifunctional UDP-N-acetylglucosamine pyrophosphorylase/glucosamine-1-phosphate N-acetyltransferase
MEALATVILAAGQGTRMRSRLPKVLHEIAGKPLIRYVVDTAGAISARPPIVVAGYGADLLRERLQGVRLEWVEQTEQRGTGHAVSMALPKLDSAADVLILYGDVPLLALDTLQRLIEAQRSAGFALLTVELPDPTGYGRIVRGADGAVSRIVEHKDATPAERKIREINTGIMLVKAAYLREWLPLLHDENAQGEYYLTDIVALAVERGVKVSAVQPGEPLEVSGINDRAQLAELERVVQRRQARRLMVEGVTLRDPERFDLRGELSCGRDVIIDVNVVLEGRIEIGDEVSIGPNNVIRNTRLGARSEVQPNCVIEDADIGADARIGPFARIRPGAKLAADVHIGNFVEIKASSVDRGSKINHLSYVGDSEVGSGVNVGAGTITCNYDGANKHKTVIEDDVFIGSDVQLVAPVRIGAGATIGAGTTVMRDVPSGKLVINPKQQREIEGWQRPRKNKK